MRSLQLLLPLAAAVLVAATPAGFRSIFNGKDLKGWHISQINHHGNTQAWTVKNGVLMGTQEPFGNGGIILPTKVQELRSLHRGQPRLRLRRRPLPPLLRKGEAYQVMLDYLEGGSIGGVYGEKLEGLTAETGTGNRLPKDWQQHWKKGEWNHIRARIEGDIPHIQVWLNGAQITDWTDSVNRAANSATEGMIAVQVHRTTPGAKSQRWIPGGYHRFRNIAVKELP
jgi:hypothetical protein